MGLGDWGRRGLIRGAHQIDRRLRFDGRAIDLMPGLPDVHDDSDLVVKDRGCEFELGREHLAANVGVEAADGDGSVSTVIHVEHGFELLEDFEAVDELLAARGDVISLHRFRRASQIANQGIVEGDHQAYNRGLLGRRAPVFK